MRTVDIEVTDRYRIRSHGNGTAFEISSGNRRAFLQGDDAAQFYKEYHDLCLAHVDPQSAWYDKTWNECLSHLCDELLETSS